MKSNVWIVILMSALTIAQCTIPIGDGKTHLSYVVILVAVISRVLFGIKIFGIDINATVIFAFEGIAIGLSSVFFFSSAYKNSFEIYWAGYIITLLLSIAMIIGVIVENVVFIYEEREIHDGSKDSDGGR